MTRTKQTSRKYVCPFDTYDVHVFDIKKFSKKNYI